MWLSFLVATRPTSRIFDAFLEALHGHLGRVA